MIAEIMSIGTELLLGDIANTNTQFLSKALAELGITVYGHTTVGDNPARLRAAFEYAFSKADMVVACGGLGPTLDDITKEIAADYFDREMVVDKPSWEAIKKRFEGRNLPDNVIRNATVPKGSLLLQNHKGSAPGVCIEQNGKTLILLPGPPHELEPMFMTYAVPFLRQKTNKVFISRVIKIIGIGESNVESILQDIISSQTNPTIAPYAKLTEVALRITASGANETIAHNSIIPIKDEIYKRLNQYIYGEDDDCLAQILINKLRGQTLSVAESCTGGLLTSAFVDIPGSSNVLKEGLITYSNESKVSRLGVSKELLVKHGAVSSQVAAAMAKGIAHASKSTIAISTTGIAGPTGGTTKKPVGLVYIGLYINGETITKKLQLIGDRNEIRARAVVAAMDFLRLNI